MIYCVYSVRERRPRVHLLLVIDVAPELRIGLPQKSGAPAASCITSPISLFLKMFDSSSCKYRHHDTTRTAIQYRRL